MSEIECAARTIQVTDLMQVTEVHRAAFPSSALTALGSEAVRRYYLWQLTGPHDVLALGCWFDDQLVGFCFGGVFRGALGGFVRTNKGFLILRVAARPWLLTGSEFRERLSVGVRALRPRRLRRSVPVIQNVKPLKSFGILSIATHPEFQRLGVARRLMAESEAYARSHGFVRMGLTVHPQNFPAVRFYEHLGWERVLGDGVWTGRMEKMLES